MENVYNEFKRNGISIPYNQLEVRSRTDTVVLGYNKRKLPQREEKQRNNAEHFDLETADFVKMIKSRQPKKNSSAKNAKTKDAIAAENSGETAVETKNKKAKKSSTKNK
jgi:hypothetical protein